MFAFVSQLIPLLIPPLIPVLIPLPFGRPIIPDSRSVERRLSAPFSNGFDLTRARRGPRVTEGPSAGDGRNSR
jgi:hypothetical protein